MLTNTASAPLRRASVNPTRSRTMSVKSNTQLSRAGGVMEASLLRGSSVLLEPDASQEGKRSGMIHLRERWNTPATSWKWPLSCVWSGWGLPALANNAAPNWHSGGAAGLSFRTPTPSWVGRRRFVSVLKQMNQVSVLYLTAFFYFRYLHLYSNICNLQFLHLKKHAHYFTHITLLR